MEITSVIERFIVDNLVKGGSRKGIRPEEPLISGGIIDSLALLQLLAFIEDEFGVEIKDSELIPENFQTISAIREFVEARLQQVGI